uniref:SLC12A transporter C-terminal domain-containing protein n=1 Tax=Sinocyclocheilus anshuiensis TaxID=1608454 RepID=A0A671P5D6_9TELE
LIFFLRICSNRHLILLLLSDVNWGSSTQAVTFINAMNNALILSTVDEHIKNFRCAQCLVMTGSPRTRPALLDLAHSFTKNYGLASCGTLEAHYADLDRVIKSCFIKQMKIQQWLNKQKRKAFYTPVASENLQRGAEPLMQVSLNTNTEMDGWIDAFDFEHGTVILRISQGMDISHILKAEGTTATTNSQNNKTCPERCCFPSSVSLDVPQTSGLAKMNQRMVEASSQFKKKQGKGTIDVWWLFDDGGLTLLLPHILTTRKKWRDCRLRIFIPGQPECIEQDKEEFIADINVRPSAESWKLFEDMIEPFRMHEGSKETSQAEALRKEHAWKITDAELDAFEEKVESEDTAAVLRLNHTRDANIRKERSKRIAFAVR